MLTSCRGLTLKVHQCEETSTDDCLRLPLKCIQFIWHFVKGHAQVITCLSIYHSGVFDSSMTAAVAVFTSLLLRGDTRYTVIKAHIQCTSVTASSERRSLFWCKSVTKTVRDLTDVQEKPSFTTYLAWQTVCYLSSPSLIIVTAKCLLFGNTHFQPRFYNTAWRSETTVLLFL